MADSKKQFSKAEAQRRFEDALRGARLATSKQYEDIKLGKRMDTSKKQKGQKGRKIRK